MEITANGREDALKQYLFKLFPIDSSNEPVTNNSDSFGTDDWFNKVIVVPDH